MNSTSTIQPLAQHQNGYSQNSFPSIEEKNFFRCIWKLIQIKLQSLKFYISSKKGNVFQSQTGRRKDEQKKVLSEKFPF